MRGAERRSQLLRNVVLLRVLRVSAVVTVVVRRVALGVGVGAVVTTVVVRRVVLVVTVSAVVTVSLSCS